MTIMIPTARIANSISEPNALPRKETEKAGLHTGVATPTKVVRLPLVSVWTEVVKPPRQTGIAKMTPMRRRTNPNSANHKLKLLRFQVFLGGRSTVIPLVELV